MNDTILKDIQSSLDRIEVKLTEGNTALAQHFVDDAIVAADVMALRAHRGYVLTSLAAVGAGITAGAAYVVERWLGHR